MARKNSNQVQNNSTSNKAKTAGVFFGGFAAGGIVGALGMHLYHKKKALDEMEENISSSRNVPIDEKSVSDPGDTDFREVPDETEKATPKETVFTVFHTEEKKNCEEAKPVNSSSSDEETSEKEGESDEVSESTGGEDSCEISPEVGNETADEAPEQEDALSAPEVEVQEKSKMVKAPKELNPIVQKMASLLNGAEFYPGIDSAENVYAVIAHTAKLIQENPDTLSTNDRYYIRIIFKNVWEYPDDEKSWLLLTNFYNIYDADESDTISIVNGLDKFNLIYDKIENYPKDEFIKTMSRFALDGVKRFLDAGEEEEYTIENLIEALRFVLTTNIFTNDEYVEIIEDIEKISNMISKRHKENRPIEFHRTMLLDIIELSGIRYTDKYYDVICPLIRGHKSSLPVLINDYNKVVKDRMVTEFAEKNSADSAELLRKFNVNMSSIEYMIDDKKFAEAKETYRDLILPITNDKNIVKEFPELNTIIRNIGDRITDMVIAEKQKATEEASSIGKEDTTNTGKTYPAKSKSKNKNRNRSRNNKAGQTQSGSAK